MVLKLGAKMRVIDLKPVCCYCDRDAEVHITVSKLDGELLDRDAFCVKCAHDILPDMVVDPDRKA